MDALTGSPVELDVAARATQRAATFEELVWLHWVVCVHWSRLYRLLARLLGNRAGAEEVVRAAFLEAWRAFPGHRGDGEFWTWLCRLAMDEARRYLAGEPRRPPPPIDEPGLGVQGIRADLRAHVDSAEFAEHLERCIAELPADCRAAVLLRDVEGLTYERATEALGLELRDFKSRLHEGRMAIRRRLEELYEGEMGEPTALPSLARKR